MAATSTLPVTAARPLSATAAARVADRVQAARQILDSLPDLAGRAHDLAWWPPGGDPAAPRARTTVDGGAAPKAGDPRGVADYRAAVRALGRAAGHVGRALTLVGVLHVAPAAADQSASPADVARECRRVRDRLVSAWTYAEPQLSPQLARELTAACGQVENAQRRLRDAVGAQRGWSYHGDARRPRTPTLRGARRGRAGQVIR